MRWSKKRSEEGRRVHKAKVLIVQRTHWLPCGGFLVAVLTLYSPHLSKPEQLLQLHLQPFTSEQTAGLQSRLESAQAGNRQLAEEIEAQQSEINALLSGLEYAIADLDNANRAFQAHGTDDLMTAMND